MGTFDIGQSQDISIFANTFSVKAFFLTRFREFWIILQLKCHFDTVPDNFPDFQMANLLTKMMVPA